MASTAQEYRYTVSLAYLSGKTETNIQYEAIKSIVIDYDYDGKNMPVIYVSLAMNKALVDKMLLNDQKDSVKIRIEKVRTNTTTMTPEIYIDEECFYFLPSDPNYNRDLDYEDGDESKPILETNQYRELVLGLMKIDHINNNKKSIYGTWKNTPLINMICYYTMQMPMVIEPINNRVFADLIVPPCSSVSEALKYLNKIHCFYNTPFRYFIDFNRGYLVSSSDTATMAKGETTDSIILRANYDTEESTKKPGQIFDNDNKVHIINVEPTQASVFTDRATDKSFNHILGITVSGESIELPLNIRNSDLSKKKIAVQRVPNDNIKYINYLKKAIDGNSTVLELNKTDIDSSILNINKKYRVENFYTFKNLDGPFLLSRKREVYLPDGDYFIMNTTVTLRKIAQE